MGVVGPDKQWTYTRDVLWQNARKSTMKKVDNQKKTGSAGGPEWRLNTLDNIVLDIIGRDSSVLTDLGVAETWSIEQDPPEQAEHSSFEVEVPAGNVVAPAVPEATTTSAATASTSSASSTPFTATSTRAWASGRPEQAQADQNQPSAEEEGVFPSGCRRCQRSEGVLAELFVRTPSSSQKTTNFKN
ncbi:uncharacterized protein LOC111048489 [Nilaparvata lugens]|uniref:uncharacterized protein LOC111048489 n=1 Tax=Nilaparvata lugens TaxID=108931 RepID=UPI000B999548|nr:uncharacterized protein LOC111048489 [Nilaparvata lugens]